MRSETMQEDRWRVQVKTDRGNGDVTHESMFKSEDGARNYFDTIAVSGSAKYLARRKAGESRYEVLGIVMMGEAGSEEVAVMTGSEDGIMLTPDRVREIRDGLRRGESLEDVLDPHFGTDEVLWIAERFLESEDKS